MPTPRYGQPRYRVIAEQLRERIETGVIPPGALLPPESALTEEFKTSRGTIRQAIAALREDGLVVTEHGRGTHAINRPDDQRSAAHVDAETQDTEIPAPADLAEIFNVEPGTALHLHQVVLRQHGAPCSVNRTYTLPERAAANRLTDR